MRKTIYFCFSLLVLGGIVSFVSCSSDDDDLKTEGLAYSQEIETSLSESQFRAAVNDVSDLITNTRASEYTVNYDKMAEKMRVLVVDGSFVRTQLLQDESLTDEERDSIQGLDDSQLAVLSVIANALKYDVQLIETRASVNKQLTCISEALVGGGVLTAGLSVKAAIKIGARTALKRAACGLLGMVGGAIAAAMIINDYNTCMKG